MRISLHPDPRKGVFETMLVLGGSPVELEAHLDRLADSLHALYRAKLPSDAEQSVLTRAEPLQHGKLRLTAVPGAAGLETQISTTEMESAKLFPTPERAVALRSFVVEEGLGPHKWADRRLLDQAAAELPAGELPLLIDRDGIALEASRGSIFSIAGRVVATPPADGRILPSITRRRTLEVAHQQGIETREQLLTLEQLRNGGELFLAGSVRGVEPIRSLDGVELKPPGELSSGIAAGLRRRWLAVPRGEPAATAGGGRQDGLPAR